MANTSQRGPRLTGILVVLALVVGVLAYRVLTARAAEREQARTQTAIWADKLDRQTTDAGVYIRWPDETLPENDPWGRPLRVSYVQGGVAEALEVRSLGPDGQDHTADDIVAPRMAMNLKGIGTGIKANAQETTANAAKGAVQGVVAGAKEALRGGK